MGKKVENKGGEEEGKDEGGGKEYCAYERKCWDG